MCVVPHSTTRLRRIECNRRRWQCRCRLRRLHVGYKIEYHAFVAMLCALLPLRNQRRLRRREHRRPKITHGNTCVIYAKPIATPTRQRPDSKARSALFFPSSCSPICKCQTPTTAAKRIDVCSRAHQASNAQNCMRH